MKKHKRVIKPQQSAQGKKTKRQTYISKTRKNQSKSFIHAHRKSLKIKVNKRRVGVLLC